MKKTALAIATAASLSLFLAGPLAADSSATGAGANTGQGGSMTDTQSVGQSSGAMGGDQETFDRLDQNGDGNLDEDELSAYGSTAAGGSAAGDSSAGGSGDMMDKMDKDGNGEVSQEEFQEGSMSQPGGSTGTGTGTGTGTTQ